MICLLALVVLVLRPWPLRLFPLLLHACSFVSCFSNGRLILVLLDESSGLRLGVALWLLGHTALAECAYAVTLPWFLVIWAVSPSLPLPLDDLPVRLQHFPHLDYRKSCYHQHVAFVYHLPQLQPFWFAVLTCPLMLMKLVTLPLLLSGSFTGD